MLERVGMISVRLARSCIAVLEMSWKKSASEDVPGWWGAWDQARAAEMQERRERTGTRKARAEFVILFARAGGKAETMFLGRGSRNGWVWSAVWGSSLVGVRLVFGGEVGLWRLITMCGSPRLAFL
jgi:hypothetical protein